MGILKGFEKTIRFPDGPGKIFGVILQKFWKYFGFGVWERLGQDLGREVWMGFGTWGFGMAVGGFGKGFRFGILEGFEKN